MTNEILVGLSDKVLKNMTAYGWPGNIRELKNIIERSVLLAKGTLKASRSPDTQDYRKMNGIILLTS